MNNEQQEGKFYRHFDTYEQYLESGHHSKTEILTRDQFLANKQAKQINTKSLESTVPNKLNDPFLDLIAERADKILNGRCLTIIFLRVKVNKKEEISGYIDFAHRLKTQDLNPIFLGKTKLLPKQTDLSYYNWKTGICASNDSPNFIVDSESGQCGLLFRNKSNQKVIVVNPNIKLDERITKTHISSPYYTQITLYDQQI